MKKLTVFAKGNIDLHETLHSLRNKDRVIWNGINEVVRARHPEALIRLRHETWVRSDAMLQCDGTIPAAVAARRLPLGPYPAAFQFSQALFTTDADVIVLSPVPDLFNTLLRHRRDGYLMSPHNWPQWSAEDLHWLRTEFDPMDILDIGTVMAHMERIIDRIRQRSDVPILVYNHAAVVPGETLSCHQGWEDALSTRIRRFNLGLIELSQRTGISVVDVDRIVACAGADQVKIGLRHVTAAGCRLIAHEVVRILEELGCFPSREARSCESV